MTRPNTAPLQRSQACVCGERHAVLVVLMGVDVVECPQVPDSSLHLTRLSGFPYTWFLRTGPRIVLDGVEVARDIEPKHGKRKK